jgi:hypothetical protein
VLVLAQPKAEGGGEQAQSAVLRMGLVGAARKPLVSGLEELPGKANYFIGNDPAKWRTNVPTYAKVHYREVYPGIDLVYYGNQRSLEYDFVVAPGADPRKIALSFKGAERLEIDAQGDLVLHTMGGIIRQHKPVIYQEVDGVRQEVAGGYVRKGKNRIGFKVAAYDSSRPLVIDPILSYSTYLGGGSSDGGGGIVADAAGNAYVTGGTSSVNFPTTVGAVQSAGAGPNAFVTKLDATGSALVYSTYLGGSGFDSAIGIAVDGAGNAYVVGTTNAGDFPTTGEAIQRTIGGATDAFVAKLDPSGSALVYSTYLGGSDTEDAAAIAVDVAGSAYVTGWTTSTNFPTTGEAVQPISGGAFDAFVTKLNPAGSALVYSTYLGGESFDFGLGIAVDTAGSAYVVGQTFSPGFPTTPGAFQPVPFRPGSIDAFVTKLDPTGSTLLYSTYLGGSDHDSGDAIAVDRDGNAFVAGSTRSIDFPTTAGAFQPVFVSRLETWDVFVTKLNVTGSAPDYSTFLGGRETDFGFGIAVDVSGNAYVSGGTSSIDFSTTTNAFQSNAPFSGNAFVTKFDPAGVALLYSTYLGGDSSDGSNMIAIDGSGNAYVTGSTESIDFPTTPGSFQVAYAGSRDAYVTKFALGPVLLVIDKDGIDDGKAPAFFSPPQVNNDVSAVGVRAALRFFRDRLGQTVVLPSGEIGQEGWYALRTIPASWTQAGGAAGFVGNPAANPTDPAPHGTGPGLGAPDASGDPQSLLRSVPNVTPLRETALSNLIGREVCAVVYDSQIGINPDQGTTDLRGRNLGTVAFQVVALTPPTNASAVALPNVEVRIRDARTICRGPFALLTNAEVTAAAQPQ